LPMEDAKPLNELHYLAYLWPPRYEKRWRQNVSCHFSHSRPLNHVGSRPTGSFAEVEFVAFFGALQLTAVDSFKLFTGILRVNLNPSKTKSIKSYVRNVRIDFRTIIPIWYKISVWFVFRTCFASAFSVRPRGTCELCRRSARR